MTTAIVGGGASGVLTAVNLLTRDHREQVVIFERGGVVGRGLAYGTTDRRHLLNVRARHMSAFADAPGDLLEWAQATGRATDPQGFLPRADYAVYLQDRLRDVADDRLTIQAGEVVDIARAGEGFDLKTEHTSTHADQVVLAYGNLPPQPLTLDGAALPPAEWNFENPWDLGRLRTLPHSAHILIVGTGLTAIDTAITLLEEGPNRHVTLVSRHGVLPCAHAAQTHVAWVTKVPDGPLTADTLAAAVHAEIEAAQRRDVDWRPVVDGLRSSTQEIWARLPEQERLEFLHRYSRVWDARRHRMPREVADRIDRYRFDGRLNVRTGTLHTLEETADGVHVTLTPDEPSQHVDAIVNCTGPRTDPTQSEDTLLQALLSRGLIAPDPLRLGLDVTTTGQVRGADGTVVPGLFTLGPSRKGSLWETTAIPEIRAQATEITATILQRRVLTLSA